MKFSHRLAAGLGLLCIGLMATLIYMRTSTKPMAPAVAYTTLQGTAGQLSALKGHVVLVNFWATSCSTCVKEMPQLIALHQKHHAHGFDTLAVAMKADPPAYVVNFVESRKLPFIVAIDHAGTIAQAFGNVELTPTSILINKQGEIVERYIGEPDFLAVERLVTKLLAAS
jgi:thiol-disulfide isomerase/thioredoxin